MQVRDSDDSEHAGLDLKDYTVGESVDEATPRVFRHHHPCVGKLNNTGDCRVDFLGEFKSKAWLAFLIIPYCLVEFIFRLWMKVKSHR